MGNIVIQNYYSCTSCIHAEDIYGRCCGKDMMLPVLLIMTEAKKCPHYRYDNEKVKEYLRNKENEHRMD